MAYEKTWTFDINRAYSPSSLTDMARYVLWYWKAFISGQIGNSGTAPPVVTSATPSSSGGSLATGTYYYRVTAVVSSVESTGSNEFTCSVSGPSGSVALSWGAVAGASTYNIYRGISTGGENAYYSTGSTTFTDTGSSSTAGSPPTLGYWWVVGSSNSTSGDNFTLSAGQSCGHDYWTNSYSSANFVRASAGSAHSWVMLRCPTSISGTSANTYYVLIDWSTGADDTITISLCTLPAPTGGSNTTAPTLSNSVSLSAVNFSMASNNGGIHLHGTIATDGSVNMLMSRDGTGHFISGFLCHLPGNLKAIDNYPVWLSCGGDTAGSNGYGTSTSYGGPDSSSNAIMRAPDNSQGGNWAAIDPVTTYLPAQADSFDGSFIDFPLFLGATTAAYRSLRGRLQDVLYFGGGASTGSVDNPSGTPAYMIAGNFWFPTNAAPIL